MGLEYEKPCMTFGELADRLISRGLSADRDDLMDHLRDVDCFRLSGYWNILKLPDGTFGDGASFAELWRLCTFDRQLRL